MNDWFWFQDEAFMALVEKPLGILGLVFAALMIATIWITVHSGDDSDDL